LQFNLGVENNSAVSPSPLGEATTLHHRFAKMKGYIVVANGMNINF
jgi:hypothetical protein